MGKNAIDTKGLKINCFIYHYVKNHEMQKGTSLRKLLLRAIEKYHEIFLFHFIVEKVRLYVEKLDSSLFLDGLPPLTGPLEELESG